MPVIYAEVKEYSVVELINPNTEVIVDGEQTGTPINCYRKPTVVKLCLPGRRHNGMLLLDGRFTDFILVPSDAEVAEQKKSLVIGAIYGSD